MFDYIIGSLGLKVWFKYIGDRQNMLFFLFWLLNFLLSLNMHFVA